MDLLVALLKNRVARIAAFVIVPVLVLLWWELDGAPGEVVAQGTARGVISEVHPRAYLVRLEDGRRVRVFRTRELAAGATVTLDTTRFESGLEQYVLPGDGER